MVVKQGKGRDPNRFYCPHPGCHRSFAELWRLKVHYRAPPDIRGSGKERGHGTELSHCPKCGKELVPGKHHVACSAGRSAPRQAAKRIRLSQESASPAGAQHAAAAIQGRTPVAPTSINGLPLRSDADVSVKAEGQPRMVTPTPPPAASIMPTYEALGMQFQPAALAAPGAHIWEENSLGAAMMPTGPASWQESAVQLQCQTAFSTYRQHSMPAATEQQHRQLEVHQQLVSSASTPAYAASSTPSTATVACQTDAVQILPLNEPPPSSTPAPVSQPAPTPAPPTPPVAPPVAVTEPQQVQLNETPPPPQPPQPQQPQPQHQQQPQPQHQPPPPQQQQQQQQTQPPQPQQVEQSQMPIQSMPMVAEAKYETGPPSPPAYGGVGIPSMLFDFDAFLDDAPATEVHTAPMSTAANMLMEGDLCSIPLFEEDCDLLKILFEEPTTSRTTAATVHLHTWGPPGAQAQQAQGDAVASLSLKAPGAAEATLLDTTGVKQSSAEPSLVHSVASAWSAQAAPAANGGQQQEVQLLDNSAHIDCALPGGQMAMQVTADASAQLTAGWAGKGALPLGVQGHSTPNGCSTISHGEAGNCT